MKKRLLVIDDEIDILDAIKIILEDMGHSVETFTDSAEGLAKAKEDDYDLIISDLRMPGMNGAQLTDAILTEKPDARILIITAYPHDQLAVQALERGAKGLLKKPFEIAKILDFLKEAS